MTEPRESAISAAIVKYLRSLPEAHARKVHGGPYGSAGEPDIDACVGGRAVKIEVKRSSQRSRLTALQRASLERWRAAGALTMVATSVEDVRAALHTAGLLSDELDAANAPQQ